MAMIKCPECGQDISDKAEMCVNCGYSLKKNTHKKRKKKAPIIILTIMLLIIIITVGGGCYVLYMNDWNFDEVSNTISNKNFSCILGHDWQDATCTTAKKCSVCGYYVGKPLGHTWRQATCTEPKTCTTCWITEGDALGHSTRMGTCNKCGEKILELEDELVKILTDIQDKVMTELEDAALDLNYASIFSGTTRFQYVINSIECCRNAYNELDGIYRYASQYNEFSTIVTYIGSAEMSLKTYSDGITVNNSNCGTVAQEISDGCKKSLDYLKKVVEYEFK